MLVLLQRREVRFVRRLTVFVLGMLILALAPVWGRVSAQHPFAVQPNLGTMTVSPAKASPGQYVTITGKTRGFVQFLPPLVQLRTAKTVIVHFPPGPCGGKQTMPLAFKTVINGGGSGGKGTKQNPPVGTVWKARFRIPKRMNSLDVNARTISKSTPYGKYYIDAIGVGIDACMLPAKSDQLVSVGKLKIVAQPIPAHPSQSLATTDGTCASSSPRPHLKEGRPFGRCGGAWLRTATIP